MVFLGRNLYKQSWYAHQSSPVQSSPRSDNGDQKSRLPKMLTGAFKELTDDYKLEKATSRKVATDRG